MGRLVDFVRRLLTPPTTGTPVVEWRPKGGEWARVENDNEINAETVDEVRLNRSDLPDKFAVLWWKRSYLQPEWPPERNSMLLWPANPGAVVKAESDVE